MFCDLNYSTFKNNLEKSFLDVDFSISSYLIILFFALLVLFAFSLETSGQFGGRLCNNHYFDPFTINLVPP